MFIEQLRRKIDIDQLVRNIIQSLAVPETGRGIVKMDEAALRRLLEEAGYRPHLERDVTMFLPPAAAGHAHILVFDKDLAFYNTTPDDIALRKSPTLKEMISIRNAIRILHDKDVVVTRQEASLTTLRREALAKLDLSFTEDDLAHLVTEGATALEKGDAEEVTNVITMLAELLEFSAPPVAFQFQHYMVRGSLQSDATGVAVYGPMVLYQHLHNALKLIEAPLNSQDPGTVKMLKQILLGKMPATVEGPGVFERLVAYVRNKYKGNYHVEIETGRHVSSK